jgi:hypothetical protein
MESVTKSVCNATNNEAIYKIDIRNTGSGNAAGVF